MMIFYRFYDGWDNNRGSVQQEAWVLVRETPKGWWIKPIWDNANSYHKWVSSTATKRHAYPNRQQAFDSFIARKKKQISILKAKIVIAEQRSKVGIPKPYKVGGDIVPQDIQDFFK